MPRKTSRKNSRKNSRKPKRKNSRNNSRKPKRNNSRKPRLKHSISWGGNDQCQGLDPRDGVWTVFGMPHCGYYQASLKLLKEKKKKTISIEITRNQLQCFQKSHNHKTSPIIFDNNLNFIGGYSDLVEYFKS